MIYRALIATWRIVLKIFSVPERTTGLTCSINMYFLVISLPRLLSSIMRNHSGVRRVGRMLRDGGIHLRCDPAFPNSFPVRHMNKVTLKQTKTSSPIQVCNTKIRVPKATPFRPIFTPELPTMQKLISIAETRNTKTKGKHHLMRHV